jgi:hypothetical protein
MSYVGHGIYINPSVNPTPVVRGQQATYYVKVTNGMTLIDYDVELSHNIPGVALQFNGLPQPQKWQHTVSVPMGSGTTALQQLNVPAGNAADEWIHCVKVQYRDAVVQNPWQNCTSKNIPVKLQVKIT